MTTTTTAAADGGGDDVDDVVPTNIINYAKSVSFGYCDNDPTSKTQLSKSRNQRQQQRADCDDDDPRATFSKSGRSTSHLKLQVKQDSSIKGVIFFPWNKWYRVWWGWTVCWSILTVFFETYQIAFEPAGGYNAAANTNKGSAIVEYIFTSIFAVDILINFNLAYYNDREEIMYDRRSIVRHYAGCSCGGCFGRCCFGRLCCSTSASSSDDDDDIVPNVGMFWIDLIGVFPFYIVALSISGLMGVNNSTTQYMSLLRLLRLVRLHRVKQLFDILQYDTRISLMWLTLIRNFGAALVWTHFAACTMFFIAKQFGFDDDTTWIGSQVFGLNEFERYVTSLYWSVVTFTTVGYGDFSPVNSAEQIWGMIYMLLNMIMSAWIIGSITLLIVKSDEKTGMYRETLQTLDQYATVHNFDNALRKRLRNQLKLDYNNREIADESVLRNFPSSVRRKLLRRLYLPSLLRTSLMKGIRQQFVDAFLSTCHVEIFSPGEDFISRGSISSDLYLLVEGSVKLMPWDYVAGSGTTNAEEGGGGDDDHTSAYNVGTSIADSEAHHGTSSAGHKLRAGDFINDVGFFTETPQTDSVRTLTVCKTLTMTRSAYKLIAQDHPGSVLRILQNLLSKVQKIATDEFGISSSNKPNKVNLPKRLEVLNAGSIFGSEYNDTSSHGGNNSPHHQEDNDSLNQAIAVVQTRAALTAVEDLIQMHINKQKDDQVTRFLFSASRDDKATISLMCDQGFDPDSADYDRRSALMVAAMKGNIQTVTKLLDYQANHSLVDMHGSSALYEAVKNGHDDVIELLKSRGAMLCMNENQVASTICQAVFDSDVLLLRRLLLAGIDVNACDYDKRTAVHIAASEGNVASLKVLDEYGANFSVKDRWGHTVKDEAVRANSGPVIEYLEKRNSKTKQITDAN